MKLFLIFFIFMGINATAHATQIDACAVLNPQAEVSEKLEAEIQGSASTLLKLGTAGGNASINIEKEVKNIFSNHADANKTVIKSKLIYLYCSIIQSSNELSDSQKLHEIRKLYLNSDTLSAPDNSIMKLESLGFVFSMKVCRQLGDSISCSLNVVNNNKTTKVTLNQNSYLIDSDSEQYVVKNIDFGTTIGKYFPTKTLIPGINVPIRLVFNGVVSHGTTIPLLKLMIENPLTYKKAEMSFKNIPLKN